MSTYKPSTSLLVAIKREIQKVCQDLSSDELLSRCLRGNTQNEVFINLYGKDAPSRHLAQNKC